MNESLIISKEDWKDWKSNKVTRLFYSACDERIDEAKETLANTAGQDQILDNFYRGFVYAYREMKEFRFEEADEIEEGDLIQ